MLHYYECKAVLGYLLVYCSQDDDRVCADAAEQLAAPGPRRKKQFLTEKEKAARRLVEQQRKITSKARGRLNAGGGASAARLSEEAPGPSSPGTSVASETSGPAVEPQHVDSSDTQQASQLLGVQPKGGSSAPFFQDYTSVMAKYHDYELSENEDEGKVPTPPSDRRVARGASAQETAQRQAILHAPGGLSANGAPTTLRSSSTQDQGPGESSASTNAPSGRHSAVVHDSSQRVSGPRDLSRSVRNGSVAPERMATAIDVLASAEKSEGDDDPVATGSEQTPPRSIRDSDMPEEEQQASIAQLVFDGVGSGERDGIHDRVKQKKRVPLNRL